MFQFGLQLVDIYNCHTFWMCSMSLNWVTSVSLNWVTGDKCLPSNWANWRDGVKAGHTSTEGLVSPLQFQVTPFFVVWQLIPILQRDYSHLWDEAITPSIELSPSLYLTVAYSNALRNFRCISEEFRKLTSICLWLTRHLHYLLATRTCTLETFHSRLRLI